MAKLQSGTRIYGNVTVDTFVTATGNVTAGNLTTAGLVTATGNATAGNILTGGIMSSTGNVTGGNVLTGGLISATANVQAGNLRTVGLVSATGNITGNFFIGNGSQLTGVTASSGAGNLWVVGRSATYYVPIISSILNIVGRTGNISVVINS